MDIKIGSLYTSKDRADPVIVRVINVKLNAIEVEFLNHLLIATHPGYHRYERYGFSVYYKPYIDFEKELELL